MFQRARTQPQMRLPQALFAPHLRHPAPVLRCGTVAQACAAIPNYEVIVTGVVVSALVHHLFMPIHVAMARKKYGVKYPALYATKENCASEEDCNMFNCVQRGHQNSLEMQPIFLALFAASAVQHPKVAAGCAVLYLVGRVLYMLGYKTGDPSKRGNGARVFFASFFALLITNMKIASIWAVGLLA